MKSRHVSAMHTETYRRFLRSLPWAAALLWFWAAAPAFAQDPAEADRISRAVGNLEQASAGLDHATRSINEILGQVKSGPGLAHARRAGDGSHGAVRKGLRIEPRRLLSIAIVPKANRVLSWLGHVPSPLR